MVYPDYYISIAIYISICHAHYIFYKVLMSLFLVLNFFEI